ncbi:hypothetical protein DB347_20430 [Opitutaceae bacterium EW11]|nr:hypothetical protein DB347_20430 [Opitutaceae bacterium EW11]
MNALQWVIDGQRGSVFEGLTKGTVAFVPSDCLVNEDTRGMRFDEARYLISGWAERNMRFSSIADGERLWPRPECPVQTAKDPRVQALLGRLRNVYVVEQIGTGDS